MAQEFVWHEPDAFQDFRCLGAACEDTCCAGWGIGVDRQTFETYQQPATTALGRRLQELIQISPMPGEAFARIQLSEAQCPFLSDALCEVQRELGEAALGQACATFPRVVHSLQGAWERSLDLSCPEAARIALLRPEPVHFREWTGPETVMDSRLAEIARERSIRPLPPYADQVRGFVIDLLQNRTYSVAERLLLLGYFCERLDQGRGSDVGPLLEGFQLAVDARLFAAHLQETRAEPAAQLGLALELVVARMALDYTGPRYRELYGEFSAGLRMDTQSTLGELGQRFSEAYFGHYASVAESLFEHYLVFYAYKNLFPFGMQGSATNQYLLLGSFFAMIRTLAVGLASHHGASFGKMHLVRAIQVSARSLEHCVTFPGRVLEILSSHGIQGAAAMSVLTQELRQP